MTFLVILNIKSMGEVEWRMIDGNGGRGGDRNYRNGEPIDEKSEHGNSGPEDWPITIYDLPQLEIRMPDSVPESVPKMPPPPSENLPPLPGQKKIKWGPINPRDVPPQKRN